MSTSRPYDESAQPSASSPPGARHASNVLLHNAVSVLGAPRVSDALHVSVAQVERLLTAKRPMALAQQRVLAVAVLVMSGKYPILRRRAAALLRQVAAAEDYAAGLTECHNHAPPTGRWP